MSRGDFGSTDYGSTGFGSASYRPSNAAEKDSDQLVFSEISGKIFKINKNVSTLEYLSRALDTDEEGRKKEHKVHEVSQETNKLAKETKNCFRKLSDRSLSNSSGYASDKERRLRLQRSKLKTEFENSLSRYHAIQSTVSSKIKTHIEQELKLNSEGKMDLSNMSDADTQPLIDHEVQQSQLQTELDQQEIEVWKERELRFREIEADILNVNEIFQDLALLVHEQGEQIDSIESNIESAAVQVEEGRVQLQRAKTYQKSARKRYCILIGILLVVAGVLALIIYLSVKK